MPREPRRRRGAPRLDLGRRIALANLAVGMGLVAALSWVQTRAAKDAIRQRARLGAEVALEQIAAQCRARLSRGESRALFDDLANVVSLQRFVYIDVFDPAGRPLVQLTNPQRHRSLTQELPGRGGQDDVLDISQTLAPPGGGGRPLGRLELGVWVRGIHDDLRGIERQAWSVGAALCALVGLVSWLLGARLARRLRELAQEIQRRGPDDLAPVPVTGGDEVASLASAFNRRQERLREERARRETAESQRQDMVHMIVHDMKGPLSVFRSGLPLLRESAAAGGDLRVRRMLDMFAEGSARLLRMADGILGLARLEDPAAPIDRRAVDLAGLARARVEAADAAAKEKGVSLDLRAGPGLPPCPADADLVGRVLDNLLSNALEHTPKGGKVQVGLERREDVLRVEVRDTGPGVPAAERERIFEKFRKGRASSRGAGLGLAFCRLAVERHGGAIGVSDVERGGGSVFYFTLPII